MDNMNFTNGIITKAISKAISRYISKKFKHECSITINELRMSNNNTKTHVHLSIDGEINTSDIGKLLEEML